MRDQPREEAKPDKPQPPTTPATNSEDNLLPEKIEAELDRLNVPLEHRAMIKDVLPHFLSLEYRESYTEHSGALPSPLYVKEYNEVIPNGAERLMRMAEVNQEMDAREQEHRHTLNRNEQGHNHKMNWAEIGSKYLGQIFAFLIALSFLYGAYLCAEKGHDSLAIAIVTTTIVALVAIFVTGQYFKSKESA